MYVHVKTRKTLNEKKKKKSENESKQTIFS